MKLHFPSLKGIFKFLYGRSKKLSIGFTIMLFLIIMALLAGVVAPYNVLSPGRYIPDRPPSSEHILGTDTLGRDVFAQLIHSIRQSLLIGFFTGLVGLLVGISIGIIGGYKGGLVDDSLRSITDVFLVIPTLPLLVVLSAYVRFLTVPTLVVILAIFSWPWPARTFRAQVLSLRKREFIDLAKLSGLSDVKIVFTEVLPNMLPYVGTSFANAVSAAILAEVFLEILGLGPQNTTTLGFMLYWAMWRGALIRGIVWWVFPPMVCLILIFIALQFINIGLDEIYNPRLGKGYRK
ncbi:MAG: ABC transporter permease [bacterium]